MSLCRRTTSQTSESGDERESQKAATASGSEDSGSLAGKSRKSLFRKKLRKVCSNFISVCNTRAATDKLYARCLVIRTNQGIALLTALISDYYYQLIAGIELVPYQQLQYKLILLRIIHEYAQGSENICFVY
jgi:hypothetical protein